MPRRWIIERRRDHYYRKAKQEDLRSRAAFKLMQLNKAFKIFREGDYVVDLGAAPGGWLKVAKESVGKKGLVVGVDIQPIKPIEGVKTIQASIEEENISTRIMELTGGKVNVVTSDCSPKVSGNWSLDHARQIYLAEKSLDIAEKILKSGGIFVCKIFQGEYMSEFVGRVKNMFNTVKLSKPKASRKGSAEIYLVAKGFRG
ncbi:MAG: RlmE family RNA methyltransferase [Candidatus Odinarchaeia archaeon]